MRFDIKQRPENQQLIIFKEKKKKMEMYKICMLKKL